MACTASSLSPSPPVVLATAVAATACSAYLLWTAFGRKPAANSIHRSNAVHRRRNGRARTLSQWRIVIVDIVEADHSTNPTRSARDYGHCLVGDCTTRGRFFRFTLTPRRLPDVEVFRHICGYGYTDAQSLADGVQIRFLNNYLAREVDSTTYLPETPDDEGHFRTLSAWGLPDHLILNAFHMHNRNIPPASQTHGPRSMATTWPANDDETDVGIELAPDASFNPATRPNNQGHAVRRTLYHIAEDQARRKGVVHRGITCDGCGTTPIRGVRWRCTNCIDYDLCSECEATNVHLKTHIFQKLKVPARYLGYSRTPMPVYFPGNPSLAPLTVPSAVRKSLEQQTQYEPEEIDGLWEQFTCLANCPWDLDPDMLGAAIDRSAFDQSFVPRYTPAIPPPSLVYDRVFAFFDSNADGVIGFREFVHGLDFIAMKGHSREKLRRIFQCYDLDGDDYVTRKDLLRIFRAYFGIIRDKTRNMVMVSEERLTLAGAMGTIESAQPLSSLFSGNPNFDSPRPSAAQPKALDGFGDPQGRQAVVLEDGQDREERSQLIAHAGELHLASHGKSKPDELTQAVDEARREAVADRWRRREFYVDEEEGLNAPACAESGHALASANADPALDGQTDVPGKMSTRPSHSRSSSRVRFADDLESDARSDISTSSRPVGERWGGYEMARAKEDYGQDILYQVAQQGCNEMLDPIFKRKEDLAMEVLATEAERRHWRDDISTFVRNMREETGADFNNDPLLRSPEAEKLMKVSPRFVALVVGGGWQTHHVAFDTYASPPEEEGMDGLDAYIRDVVAPFERDVRQAIDDHNSGEPYGKLLSLARSLVAMAAKRIRETRSGSCTTTNSQRQLDELLQRLRPVNDAEEELGDGRFVVNATAPRDKSNLAIAYERQREHRERPSDGRLARLAVLEGVENDLETVGRGRIGFDEFAEAMQGPAAETLAIVESWLEFGSL